MQAVTARASLDVGPRAKAGASQTKRSTPLSTKQTLQGAPLRAHKPLRWRATAQSPKAVSMPINGSSVSTNGGEQEGPVPGVGWQGARVFGNARTQSQDMLMEQYTKTRIKLFAGTSNQPLSEEVAAYMGLPLSPVTIKRFADGEIYVQVLESIRGCDVFIVQPTCPPCNDNMMELLVMIDACRRASARSITAVIPYFGYARADRKVSGRESIAAKLMANLITEAGTDRVLVVDLHSGQGVGYFDIPVDLLHGQCVALEYLASKLGDNDYVVVSPDVGGVGRARAFAKKLNDAPLAIIDKRRQAHNEAEVMNLIGEVDGKIAIMIDDMIDTAGTLTGGARLLKEKGARAVIACATHAVFSPPAVERLSSGLFEEVIVTNTMPVTDENQKTFPQLTVLSVANLLGEAIWRVYNESSVQVLFK
uniref:ribose-phosphate diphosphokinase n=1 Tax=Pyramimonas obovata TaxID=1411642 RepID=A0A7S0RPG3_9CHLO|mmetsp:Transcript_39461/g.85893  ORF Transcript_39461/g.85893 Transcript_39461/m.85893 type:complete len:421 (+) Transcript_39461:262-1524(+)